MRITVFAASGRTGLPFVEQALAADHDVVAFVLRCLEEDRYVGEMPKVGPA